jgi:hypothetical protein
MHITVEVIKLREQSRKLCCWANIYTYMQQFHQRNLITQQTVQGYNPLYTLAHTKNLQHEEALCQHEHDTPSVSRLSLNTAYIYISPPGNLTWVFKVVIFMINLNFSTFGRVQNSIQIRISRLPLDEL